MAVKSKLDFELAKGRTFKIKIEKMQQDLDILYKPHEVCSDCSSKIARKKICTNESCKFHNDFPSSDDTKRTFEVLKTGEIAKDVYEKQHIDNCKKLGTETITVLGTESKDFDRTRITNCVYINPVATSGMEYQGYCILHTALQSDLAVSVSHARTGSEKLAIITLEKGNMVMFDVAHSSMIRPPKFNASEIKPTQKMFDIAKAWIESKKEVDTSKIESKTTKNFEDLLNGKPITTELTKVKEELEAEDLFAVGISDEQQENYEELQQQKTQNDKELEQN